MGSVGTEEERIMITAVLIILANYGILSKLLGKFDKLTALALSYIIGLGLTTYVSFLLYLCGVTFSKTNYILSLLILFVCSVMANWKEYSSTLLRLNIHRIHAPAINLKSIDPVSIVTGLILTLLLIFGLYWPVRDWDALTLYDFRAQVIVKTGSLEFLKTTDPEYYFAYPLFTSLAHAFVYTLDVTGPMFMYALMYTCFALIYKHFVFEATSNSFMAKASTLLLVSSPVLFSHAILAYTNLPFSIMLSLGLFVLTRWVKTQELGLVILSSIILGLSVWMRGAEPFWILVPILVILFARKYKIRLAMLSLGICLCFILPWSWFSGQVLSSASFVHSTQSLSQGLRQISIDYVFSLIKYLWLYFIEPYWGLHIMILLLTLQAMFGKPRAEEKVGVVFMILIYGMVFAGTVYLSLIYPKWIRVGGSLTRLSIFLIPLIYYLSSSKIWYINEKK